MTSFRRVTSVFATAALLAALPLVVACGGDDDAGDPDAAPDNPDAAGTIDAPEEPDAEVPDAAIPPDPPTVTTPAASAPIFSPVLVEGSAEPSAAINIVVLDDGFDVGSAVGAADSAGNFSFNVSYTNADAADPLTVRVTQTSRGMISDPTDIAVTQLAVFELGGDIDQANDGSSFAGTVVKVRLYDSATEVLDFVQEVEVTATNSLILTSTPYSFNVPNGTYTVRAFRDSHDPWGGSPDGHPSMWFDAQVPGTTVAISGAESTSNDITLVNPAGASGYFEFDVFTMHESYEAQPPEDMVGDDGLGLCRGYYMRMRAYSSDGNESAPMVRLPDGSDTEMLDDGGCDQEVADNTDMSYDEGVGDNSFSRGIPNPTALDAGDYTLHYRDTVRDLIHSQVDHIDTVLKLTRKVPALTPTGAAHETDLTPTITWDAVAGADIYDVIIFGRNDYNNGEDAARRTASTTYTVSAAQQLADDEPYVVAISPEAMDPVDTDDIDAIAFGMMNFFIVDTAGDDAVTLSGTIDNISGETGDLIGIGLGSELPEWWGPQASIVLPPDATSYAVDVLPDPMCPLNPGEGQGQFYLFIDVLDAGDFEALGLDAYASGYRGFEVCADVPDLDMRFTPPVVATYPTDGTTATGITPNFQWEDYATTFQAATGTALSTELTTWSYVWYASEQDSPPVVLYGVPNTATNYDMASPPTGTDAYDIGPMMGGASAADLTGYTDLRFSVMVVDCDYSEYISGTASVYTDCIQALVDSQGQDTFATTGEIDFSVD